MGGSVSHAHMLAPSRVTLSLALLALACCSSDKSKSAGEGSESPPPRSADAAAVAEAPADAAAEPTSPPAADPFAPIGVEPCDKYIAKQRECVTENAPEGIKQAQLGGLAEIATRWRAVAAAGAEKPLVSSCEHLLDASREATAAWSCKW